MKREFKVEINQGCADGLLTKSHLKYHYTQRNSTRNGKLVELNLVISLSIWDLQMQNGWHPNPTGGLQFVNEILVVVFKFVLNQKDLQTA
jgi:hypothetical protein